MQKIVFVSHECMSSFEDMSYYVTHLLHDRSYLSTYLTESNTVFGKMFLCITSLRLIRLSS